MFLKYFYLTGMATTGITIGTGNLLALTDMCYTDVKKQGSFAKFLMTEGLFLSGIIAVKTITYSITWPTFVPYAYLKSRAIPENVTSDQKLTFFPNVINKHGFIFHLIPCSSTFY